ncbi:MAG: lysostaphin resistance A-like protein [Eubacteriales bacterium]
MSLFAGIILMSVSMIIMSEIVFPSETVKAVVSIIMSAIRLAVPALIFSSMQKAADFDKIKLEKAPEERKKNDLLIAFLGFVLVFVSGLLYAMAFPNAATSYNDKTFIAIILSLIDCVVIPAFLEEYLYRYLFCRELTVFGNSFAVIISAMIFGLTHYSFAVFPYAFICGIIIGIVYIATGSLKYTVAIHFMNNFLSYVFSLIGNNFGKEVYSKIVLISIIILCVMALITLYFLVPNGKISLKEYGNVSSSVFLTFPMIIFIICAIIINFL